MKHYTLQINQKEKDAVVKVYRLYETKPENEYIIFQAKRADVSIKLYHTLKLLISGTDVLGELSLIKELLNRKDYQAIGSDEAGTGDVFGPVVVCSCYTNLEDIEFLENLGVKDSKTMNDQTIIRLAKVIAKRLTHSLLILTPKKYNELTQKGYNLNKIKALLHNQVIIKTTDKIKEHVPVIIDQFCSPHLYFNYLKDETLIYRDLDFKTKAESYHISVAAASIIARYAFLAKMQEYSQKLGVKLAKGANKLVDEVVLEVHKKHGMNILSLVAKTNFKNITKLDLN